jgi:hypothetical protein
MFQSSKLYKENGEKWGDVAENMVVNDWQGNHPSPTCSVWIELCTTQILRKLEFVAWLVTNLPF